MNAGRIWTWPECYVSIKFSGNCDILSMVKHCINTCDSMFMEVPLYDDYGVASFEQQL